MRSKMPECSLCSVVNNKVPFTTEHTENTERIFLRALCDLSAESNNPSLPRRTQRTQRGIGAGEIFLRALRDLCGETSTSTC